jgi:hypothetical protein
MGYTERPLTPTLSPSEGEREKHRQVIGVVHIANPFVMISLTNKTCSRTRRGTSTS